MREMSNRTQGWFGLAPPLNLKENGMRTVELSDEQVGMLMKIFAETSGPYAWAELVADLRRQLRGPIQLVEAPGVEDGESSS